MQRKIHVCEQMENEEMNMEAVNQRNSSCLRGFKEAEYKYLVWT